MKISSSFAMNNRSTVNQEIMGEIRKAFSANIFNVEYDGKTCLVGTGCGKITESGLMISEFCQITLNQISEIAVKAGTPNLFLVEIKKEENAKKRLEQYLAARPDDAFIFFICASPRICDVVFKKLNVILQNLS